MGAADIVPGVSGGTIAFISGIYEELVDSIGAFSISSLKILKNKGFFYFWKRVNGNFLLTLGCGILFSVAFLSRAISHLLTTEPILIWSFFFGLILASIGYILRQIPHFRCRELTGLLIGTAIVIIISMIPKMDVSHDPFVLFLAGSIAVCAMILPGISGSFILLLLGIYPVVIDAISDLQWNILITFSLGCIFGILAFSRILASLLKTYYALTISCLTGFLIGSLLVIWPWKVSVGTASAGIRNNFTWPYQLMMPGDFMSTVGQNPQTYAAIGCMLLGFSAVIALEFFGRQSNVQEG